MIRFSHCPLVAPMALVVLAAVPANLADAADPVLTDGCFVKFEDDIQLPAREPGVLVYLEVKEGSQVYSGQEIGKIDESEPLMQKRVAEVALKAAQKRAENDVEIRYAQAAADVAKTDYDQYRETNLRRPGAIAQTDVRRAKLEWDRSVLAIEKSQEDRLLAEYEADTRKAELDAADQAIDRRVIRAPFDGEVVSLFRYQDEWVSPGDPILRLVRLDTMRVQGSVDGTKYDPHEIRGCNVTVEVESARGNKIKVPGQIRWVSPMIEHGGMYRVRAEVANPKEDGRWLLHDGQAATMTIHLGTGGGEVAGAPR